MRNCLLVFAMVLCCFAAARPGYAQTPDPTLLRITFIAAPTATPEFTPTIAPTTTPTIVPTEVPTPIITPTIVPTVLTPTVTPPAVPEPATLTLFGLSAVAVAYLLRRTRRRNRP